MPWKETSPVRERARFIRACESGLYSMQELADRFGVSRKTAHKWKARHYDYGLQGLEDRSRAPHSSPLRTDEELEDQIVAFRQRFPFMGPAKIIARLEELHPNERWPAISTAGEILKRHDLIRHKQRRRPPVHPDCPIYQAKEPNDLFTIDYKGQFRLGNGTYCYPLTIVDYYSRYLLVCQGLPSNDQEPTWRVFERLFRERGLPRAIRSDNGSPFASPGICRLSRLSVWWIRLGIQIQRISPGRPEQNGAHERMHRTLKEQTTIPPSQNLAFSRSDSISFVTSTTKSGRTKPSVRSDLLFCTGLPHAPIRPSSHRLNIHRTLRLERWMLVVQCGGWTASFS